ncbi:Chaperone protein DnaJ 1 [Zea mays]|uniref:Chaperone protein DnaJ 1 n=1 Tax=Zea mays TaxID=4577 RepID=A0A3L6DRG5_MAIZE|nr:Chaperone protein DnaJ 1 [Zea mays]
MECNRDEAARAKALAERKMMDMDFVGAKKMIIKAQQLLQEVDDVDIPKMLTVCDVHSAAGAKVNTEIDWYGILQVPVNADDALIKKQYRKLALLLHPDKNKFGGAEAAFKLVGEANITLTDRSKRSVHDMKRTTFRSVTARPSHQPPKRPAPARSSSTPVNLHTMHQQHQYQASNPTGPQTTFWTICPACGMKYQYYLSILKKVLRCQNCLKSFIAHDLKDQAIPSGANQRSAGVWKNAGTPQNSAGPQSNVTGQKGWSATSGVHVNTSSHHANVNTKRKADGNAGGLKNKMKSAQSTRKPSKASSSAGLKRGRRAAFESSESSISETSSDSEEEILKHGPSENRAGPGQQTRRSSRQKQEVKYNEDSDDDNYDAEDGNTVEDDFFGSPALKRLRKGGLFHGDHSTKTAKLNEDTTGHNGVSSCSNIKGKKNGGLPCEEKTSNCVEQMKREPMHVGENSDGKEELFHSVRNNGLGLNDDDASDDNKFTFPDPEFFDFDKLRDASQFRANQVWAVYDDQGCMPRFYARITKVKMVPKFMLNFMWLEFNPANKAEEAWSYRGLPVACGHFTHGQSETTSEIGMFSQIISLERSKTNNFYEIYPRKGEVWALFKGWDIGWSSDAGNHKKMNHRYEVVQVLSDLTTSTSIIVMPLVKLKGYVSLFVQSGEAAPYVIPQGDTLRFSHCVPHYLMSGTEKEGIPEGSLELDPAALPSNLEEAFPSANPECSSVRSKEHNSKHAGLSSEDCKGTMNVGQRQQTKSVNAGIATKTPNEEKIKHNTHLPEVTDVDDDNICQTEYVCAESEFYDFSRIRFLQKFSSGQIWALYSDIDKFPNYYAFIQKVDLKNGTVQVRWLDVCPRGEVEKRLSQEERTIGIGTFRLGYIFDMMTYTGTDPFSHPVKARATGRKGEYEILPRHGEIWAVYKNWEAVWTAQDFEKCEYELVEILGHTDSSIQVQLLRKVDGYKMVFMSYRAEGSVMTIRNDEYPKFSHQIPCFRLTHEKGGKLRGYLELDPLSVPEEFLD